MSSDDVGTDGEEVVEDAQVRTTTRGTVDPDDDDDDDGDDDDFDDDVHGYDDGR